MIKWTPKRLLWLSPLVLLLSTESFSAEPGHVRCFEDDECPEATEFCLYPPLDAGGPGICSQQAEASDRNPAPFSTEGDPTRIGGRGPSSRSVSLGSSSFSDLETPKPEIGVIPSDPKGEIADLNEDGDVDIEDFDILIDYAMSEGALGWIADADQDGDEDWQDVYLLVSTFRFMFDMETEETLERLVDSGILTTRGYFESGIDMAEEPGEHVQYSSWDPEDPTHVQYFSAQAPPNHQNVLSSWHPPNHDYAITQGWFPGPIPPDHGWLASIFLMPKPIFPWGTDHWPSWSLAWPANHINALSRTWPTGGTHSKHDSRQWPPNHFTPASNGWREDHLPTASATWPPGHLYWFSRFSRPTGHSTIISQTWPTPPQPGPELPWPPNHVPAVSASYPGGHQAKYSKTWPPSHFYAITATWPSPNTLWPPNHVFDVSRTWIQPPVPPPVPGHSLSNSVLEHWLTSSILEVIPLRGGGKKSKDEPVSGQDPAPLGTHSVK